MAPLLVAYLSLEVLWPVCIAVIAAILSRPRVCAVFTIATPKGSALPFYGLSHRLQQLLQPIERIQGLTRRQGVRIQGAKSF